jgi:hypothetical protein
MKKLTNILFQIALVSSLFALAGCSDEKASSTPETCAGKTDPSKTLRGQFDVYWTLQTSPTRRGGTGQYPDKVSAIHFHDTYIVTEGPDAGGRVFPIDKIIDFRWSVVPQSESAAGASSEE